MAAEQPPSGDRPPRKPPKDARIIERLQAFNDSLAGLIWRWLCITMTIVSFFLKRPEGLTFFGGAAIASLSVGKSKDG